jgi:hypothetical protein
MNIKILIVLGRDVKEKLCQRTEVYLCYLGCVVARHMGRAVGGAVEGGVVNVMCTAGSAPKRRARHSGCLLWSPTGAARSQGRGRWQVPRHALLARALATGAAVSMRRDARRLLAVWQVVRVGAPSHSLSRGRGNWALVWHAPQLGFRFGAPLGSRRQGVVPFPKRVRGRGGLSRVIFYIYGRIRKVGSNCQNI